MMLHQPCCKYLSQKQIRYNLHRINSIDIIDNKIEKQDRIIFIINKYEYNEKYTNRIKTKSNDLFTHIR